MTDKVFIALQNNEDARPIIDAILEDNPEAICNRSPGMVKIDVPGRLVVRRETVADKLGRDFDLQEIHVHLISMSGNLDEDEDEFVLHWRN
ncbi:MAG: MmoB/DmpM family protein [Gammaproteobacteria bacterium]|nr:MmoB/DmpM family protein [Gammaproteobacteria bacterium]